MTPAEIETAARRKYNSASSNFYSSAEVYDLIYQAECEIARETKMLEGSTTVSGGSISGTQSYAYPTGVLEIKRVTYNGAKLEPITFSEDDTITLFNANTTSSGTPIYYFNWGNSIYLRPIPDTSSIEIKVFHYKEPLRATTATQVLETPAIFHMSIVDYVTAEFGLKDKQLDVYSTYMNRWTTLHLPAMKKWVRKRRTGDKFQTVKDVDNIVGTNLGVI